MPIVRVSTNTQLWGREGLDQKKKETHSIVTDPEEPQRTSTRSGSDSDEAVDKRRRRRPGRRRRPVRVNLELRDSHGNFIPVPKVRPWRLPLVAAKVWR